MKMMILSDIHGFSAPLEAALEIYRKEGCSSLLLLGDILYHGPRNSFDDGYRPTEVIELLNGMSDQIVGVRGNCDSEVDQMVLQFSLMSDYHIVLDGDRKIFLSHGHIYNEDNMPPLKNGDILANGHSHIARIVDKEGITLFNPGSISLPRNSTSPSFGIYEEGNLKILSLEGKILKEKCL